MIKIAAKPQIPPRTAPRTVNPWLLFEDEEAGADADVVVVVGVEDAVGVGILDVRLLEGVVNGSWLPRSRAFDIQLFSD